MSRNGVSRRDVIRSGGGIVAAATMGLSGCTGGDYLPGRSGGATKQAPEDSAAIVSVDVQGILNDDATKELANAFFSTAAEDQYYDGPENYEEALTTAEEEAGLPPTKLQNAVGFWSYDSLEGSGQSYGGVILTAEWEEDDLVDALEESGTEFDEGEYSGKTIYESQGEYSDLVLGVLGGNKYVLGDIDAVEDAIDVKTGDGDAIETELQNAFEQTKTNAKIRFATEVPDEHIPERVPVGRDESIELDAYQDVNYAGTGLYSTGGKVGFEAVMLAEDADAAEAVKDQTEALINVTSSLESTTDEMEAFLDEVEVGIRSDTVVTISYETEVDALVDQIEAATERFYD